MRTATPKLAIILWLAHSLLWWNSTSALNSAEIPPTNSLELKVELQTGGLAPPRRVLAATHHLNGLSADQVRTKVAQAKNETALLREKSEGSWFAALLSLTGPAPLSIQKRFHTWDDLAGFIRTNNALVEVWADPGGSEMSKARRITARELAAHRKDGSDQPTLLTLTYRDPVSGKAESSKIEFGYNASAQALRSLRAKPNLPFSSSTALESAPAPLLSALHLEGAGFGTKTSVAPSEIEKLCQTGGVIEQVIAGESRADGTLPDQREPLPTGSENADERWSEVLGDLLEWRHYLQKKALGLPMEASDLQDAAESLEDLGRKGIWVDDADALVSVDAFDGSFVYRRYVRGLAHRVKVTRVPSRADLVRDVNEGEIRQRFEGRERAALAPEGNGFAQIHQVQDVNGHPEVGSLVLSEEGAEGINTLFELMDRLPAVDQARLRDNRFSRTLIEADLDGHGKKDRFFLTLKFPPGKPIYRERTNPLTGERERIVQIDGVPVRTITDTRITELDYGPDQTEARTRVYANTGTRSAPIKGSLLEETRTVESWERDLTQFEIDPNLPTRVKSRVNHVTGQSTREIYGLFPLPLATIDEDRITYRQFNPYGVLMSASVFDNGENDQDFQRHILLKLNDPIVGRQRFQLTSTLPPSELAELRTLKKQGYVTTLLRRDLVKGPISRETFDQGPQWRKIEESYTDRLEGSNGVPVRVTLDYRNDFFFGQIPVRTTQRHSASGRVWAQTETKSFDPFARLLVGEVVDHTGRITTNVWDHRWVNAIQVQYGGRTTTNQFNRDETEVAGTTTATDSGEELERFNGRFDARSEHWQMDRVLWYRPGRTNESQTLVLSNHGRLLSVRSSDVFEKRFLHSSEGLENEAWTYRTNSKSRLFDVLQEREDEYQWSAGERNARIQRYRDGQLYDSFRRVTDVEGRTRVDHIREAPGWSIRTVVNYDGHTMRPLNAETLQNGQSRTRRQWQTEQRQANGTWIVPVTTVPFWGLSFTETFRIGDALSRPGSCRLENGESLIVTRWFEGTAIPRNFDLHDRAGHVKERFSRHPNAGMEGTLSYDLIDQQKLNIWGAAAEVEEKAVVCGTDLLLFRTASGTKVYYDLSQPTDVPSYVVDPKGKSGSQVRICGHQRDHVLAISRGRLEALAPKAATRRGKEQVLLVDSISLDQVGALQGCRRVFDRAGNLLDARMAELPGAAKPVDEDDALFTAYAKAIPTERFHYRYDPGWWIEHADSRGEGRSLAFTTKQPGPGVTGFAINTGAWREEITSIEGIKPAPHLLPAPILKDYIFRRVHSPRRPEHNPFLPDSLDVWTSWTTTEFSPDRQTVFESERFYDVQARLSVSKTSKAVSPHHLQPVTVYQLPDPKPNAWKRFDLATGTNRFPLGFTASKRLDECAYIYFFLRPTNRVSWSAVFQSASGHSVRLNPSATGTKQGEVSLSSVANFRYCLGPERIDPETKSFVNSPPSLTRDEALVLVSVPDLGRAGLDVAQLTSATLEVNGLAGQIIEVSAVDRVVRERQPQVEREKRQAEAASFVDRASSVQTKN